MPFALRVCSVASVLVISAALAAGKDRALRTPLSLHTDSTSPRIFLVSPPANAWIVNNTGLVEVRVAFDEPVLVPTDAVTAWTLNRGTIADFASDFDTATNTLVLTFGTPIRDDRVTIVVDYTVTDSVGNALDGEIFDPSNPLLPSGDGLPGGQGVFRFNVLAGDVNRNGAVDSIDGNALLAAIGTCAGAAGFNPQADLNADGCINTLDVATFTLNRDHTLPTTDVGSPSVLEIRADPQIGPAGAIPSLTVTFSDAINPDRFQPQSCFVVDSSAELLVPTSASLNADRHSAIYEFNPSLPSCSLYFVTVSNSLADDSGNLLLVTPLPITFGTVPPAPMLDPHPAVTTVGQMLVTGTAQAGAMVKVSGPLGICGSPLSETCLLPTTSSGTFSAPLTLQPNHVNRVYFTTISGCDSSRSAPQVTSITHDTAPPSLFVDSPPDGAQVTAAFIDVIGRVGDPLTGSLGMTVTVNGVPAEVDLGIGTDGTFLARDVPLQNGAPTQLTIVALDGAGNSSLGQISVTRVNLANDPRLTATGGNAQSALVRTVLPAPLIVTVTNGDGTPLVNKLVTFDVTRSDGLLSADGQTFDTRSLQTHSDENGLAQAFWRLGSDAGSGNNRVTASSVGITGDVFFSASANPNAASQINIGSGNDQRGETGSEVAFPLIVWASDGRNGIPQVPVTFSVLGGAGAVNGSNVATVDTDSSGHAAVAFRFGLVPGNAVVEATFSGNVGLPATFTLLGLERNDLIPTTFEGVVEDNANRPIQDATCRLVISGATVGPIQSDINGRFAFTNIPTSGPAFVYVDGLTATHIGGAAGADIPVGSFPSLAYAVVIVPNAVNSLPTPVLLPPLDPVNARVFDNTADVELTVAGIEGLTMLVRAGSMRRYDGSVPSPQDPAVVSLNQVHFDKMPMPMPDGAAPPYSGTLQPGGAHFDPPVEVTFPNMMGLPPGAVASFMSFDHDTHRFEIVATAHVTDDGCCVVTDPGSGISTAGWHGPRAPVPTGGAGGSGGENDDDSDSPDEDCRDAECEPAGTSSPPGSPTPEDSNGSPGGEADPVYVYSGEFYHAHEDMRIRGRGLDFIWARKYRSKIEVNSRQGIQWDYSYNISIASEGSDIALYDGNTRQDIYRSRGSNSWARPGFFRELTKNPNNTFTLQFADKGEWNFRALDGNPAAGRIMSIIDRNGNTLSFGYDGLGRLITVTDTLGRDITISYNPNDLIAAVTDFAGRSVAYEYYDGSDPGGGAGDLKSVRTPVVTGTPTGNDFPAGKTTIYTYTKGFSEPRLNHDLLTITDAKGQVHLQNTYAHTLDAGDSRYTTNSGNLYYDRVVSQTWGNPDDIIEFVYLTGTYTVDNLGLVVIPPGALDRFDPSTRTFISPYATGTQKTIVNDRSGNVREYVFDARNRLLSLREFTGRANPGVPTTESTNRPTNALRAEDPTFFETRYKWNSENRIDRILQPNGRVHFNLYELDLDDNAPQRKRGNLRVRQQYPAPPVSCLTCRVILVHPITETFEYDTNLVDDGFNFITRHSDGRAHETTHKYDPNGNRIRTIHRIPSVVEEWDYNQFGQVVAHTLPANDAGRRRRDEYTYYSSGPQSGYMHQEIIDTNGLALTTAYGYDAVGNITRKTDPKGKNTLFTVNQLNQVVREESRPVVFQGGPTVPYVRDTYYDANNNVVRLDVRNINDQGQVESNSHFTTVFEYEFLNNLTKKCEELGSFTGTISGPTNLPTCSGLPASEFITTDYQYDKNRNRTRVRFGEAAEGRQPANIMHFQYDERNLLFREIRAQGNASQSTTQYDYDKSRNLTRVHQGTEDSPRVTEHFFDRYDRRIATLDPMGNLTTYFYDNNHNLTQTVVHGERDDQPGGEGDLGACINLGVNGNPFQICDPPGATNVVLSDTNYVYDDINRLTETQVSFFDTETGAPIGDGAAVTQVFYTATSQVLRVVDDNNNQATYTYDTANRRKMMTDAKGNTTAYGYDANSNLTTITTVERSDTGGPDQTFVTTVEFDAVDRPITVTDNVGNITQVKYDSRNNRTREIDAKGNVVRNDYDGLSRLTATHRELRDTGDGSGTLVGTITTTQAWDDTSRLVSQTDDSNNTTAYGYDALNRLVQEQFADGTSISHTYDVHHNRLITTDANGSVVTNMYDLLNRVTSRSITPGPGVASDTTAESFKYDGLSRIVRAEDNDSIVLRSFDSRWHLVRETLNGQTTASVFDGVDNMTACTYPGGRQITTTFDSLNRKKTIADQNGSIATYNYVGPRRVERKDLGNGTRCAYEYDGITGIPNPPGDESIKRIIHTTHTKIAGGTVIDDRSYLWDKVGNKKQRKDQRVGGPELVHDYAYDSAYRLIRSIQTPPGGPASTIEYNLDDVHNRIAVTGGPDPGPYTMSAALPDLADRQMNQYTTTSFDTRVNDKNGNLTRVNNGQPDQRNITYDYRNQMVSHIDTATGTTTTYAYDVLGRRIAKVVNSGSPQTTRFFYSGLHVIEEQDESNATLATYVFGRYLDEVLTMRRGGASFYYHADDMHNVMALTDSNASTVERYEYGDYGKPSFFDASGAPIPQSAVGNPYLFTGSRFDPETRFYHNRTRYLDPIAGRFTTRDTIGIWGDPTGLGNGYAYAAGNPWTFRDPFGFGPDGSGGDEEGDGESDWFDDLVDDVSDGWDEFSKDVSDAADAVEEFIDEHAPTEQQLDELQTSLDLLGFVPGLGLVPDLVNAGVSAGRGNWADTAINVVAAVPVWGDAAKAVKMAEKAAVRAVEESAIKQAEKIANKALRNTPDQDALIQLAKDAKKTGRGVSEEDVTILKQWGDEVGVGVRGPEVHPERPHGQFPHIHVGPVSHIPVR